MSHPHNTFHLKKSWIIGSKEHPAQVDNLSKELNIHPLVVRMIFDRGIQTAEEIDRYIHPSLKNLYDPFLMLGMKEAVYLILKALERGDRIMIHGDYDVDGVSSVSLLYSYLRDFGANVSYFVPRRDQEGYGIAIRSVDRFHRQGYKLLISTDCGISNADEVQHARDLGMTVIIVDHHKVPPRLPPAHVVINPLQEECPYPFKPLAAVGVTFLLAAAIRRELRSRGIFNSIPEPDLREYLDLVALGTVADVMPLQDQNRILVHHGLRVLAARRRPGIAALMEKINIPEGRITTNDISFKLAPRLNAAGRVDDASLCVELLTTTSFAEAMRLTRELEDLNILRKDEERQTLDSALEIARLQDSENHQILLLSHRDWHHGVLGIVASRIVDAFHKPTIMLHLDDDGVAKGSARAVEGFDLVELFTHADDLLLTYGGHKLAAGLSLREESIPKLHERLNDKIIEHSDQFHTSLPTLQVDDEVCISDLSPEFMSDLAMMAPFGSGNPEPSLLCRSVVATMASVVGRNHIRMKLVAKRHAITAFGFSLGHFAELANTRPITIVYSPRIVHRRGTERLELFIRGIRDSRSPLDFTTPE